MQASHRDLKRRKAEIEHLSQQKTAYTRRVNRIVAVAEKTFGNSEKARLWVQSPDERLAGSTPLNMLDTESGEQIVESMLWQLDEGIYT